MLTGTFKTSRDTVSHNMEVIGTSIKRNNNILGASWNIQERGAEWNLVFLQVDEYAVYSVPRFKDDVPFRCQFSFSGWTNGDGKISINSADMDGRHLVADRYLKRFIPVVAMMCGLIKYGYVKL